MFTAYLNKYKKYPIADADSATVFAHGSWLVACGLCLVACGCGRPPVQLHHRFAQFFTGPLMARDAMEREREAVDSEFQMALPSDDNRLCQVRGGCGGGRHLAAGDGRPGRPRPPHGQVYVGEQGVAGPGGCDGRGDSQETASVQTEALICSVYVPLCAGGAHKLP